MNGLVLSGYGCKSWIWRDCLNELKSKTIKRIDWPKHFTKSFHHLKDYALWIKDTYLQNVQDLDLIIGHSMGGLVALELSKLVHIDRIVLVESFITSPKPFFQNLLMEDTDKQIKDKVLQMFKDELPFYSKELGDALKNIDMTALVYESSSKIYCVYGDRGTKERNTVINSLDYSIPILDKIEVHIVPNSCHFPMIENYQELTHILTQIIDKKD